MRLNDLFPELSLMLERIGARRSDWTSGTASLDPREQLRSELEQGKEIPLDAVKDYGGLLVYEGEPVVLYILETRLDRYTVENTPEESRRFHIAECETLTEMRRVGRGDRYVASQSKTGLFRVTCIDEATEAEIEIQQAKLHVCKNCLRLLNWNAYSSSGTGRDSLWRSFEMQEFFDTFQTFFHVLPEHTDKNHPIGGYVREWSQLSLRIRRERGWLCEECCVNLTEHPKLLHCHHKDGRVWNNRPLNIAALCLLCHSKKPLHGRIKVSVADRMLIERLRAVQRLRAEGVR
jgi:hypothetical protein